MIAYPIEALATKTRVIEAGPEVGPPVLLVHGLTSRADRWMGALEVLGDEGFRAIAIDLPGHGFATKDPLQAHSVPFYRDFVIDVLDVLKIDAAHLVGTSLGGFIVGAACCSAADRCQSLTLIGSLGFEAVSHERVETLRAVLGDVSKGGIRAQLTRVIEDTDLVTDDLVREDWLINSSDEARGCVTKFLGYMDAGYNDDLILDRLVETSTECRTLLLWGERDRSVPVEIGHAAFQRLPAAKFVTIAEAGHMFYLEEPDILRAVLTPFVSRTSATSTDERITVH